MKLYFLEQIFIIFINNSKLKNLFIVYIFIFKLFILNNVFLIQNLYNYKKRKYMKILHIVSSLDEKYGGPSILIPQLTLKQIELKNKIDIVTTYRLQ